MTPIDRPFLWIRAAMIFVVTGILAGFFTLGRFLWVWWRARPASAATSTA